MSNPLRLRELQERTGIKVKKDKKDKKEKKEGKPVEGGEGKAQKKEKKEKAPAKEGGKKGGAAAEPEEPVPSMVDLRVGKIVDSEFGFLLYGVFPHPVMHVC